MTITKDDLRLVGYGMIGSAIMATIYECVPLYFTGHMQDIPLKVGALVAAVVVGVVFVKGLPRIIGSENNN